MYILEKGVLSFISETLPIVSSRFCLRRECEQHKRRSVCASEQSHQHPCCSLSRKHIGLVETKPCFGVPIKRDFSYLKLSFLTRNSLFSLKTHFSYSKGGPKGLWPRETHTSLLGYRDWLKYRNISCSRLA